MIALAMSSDAMIAYSGDVVVFAWKNVLNRSWMCGSAAFRMWTMLPCDSAVRTLCVDCVAKTVPTGPCGVGARATASSSPSTYAFPLKIGSSSDATRVFIEWCAR